MFGVKLRGFRCVVGGVVGVSVGGMGVVSSFLVVSGLVMLRGFLMVSRRMLVMLGRFAMMLGSLLGHARSSFFRFSLMQFSSRQGSYGIFAPPPSSSR
jgi:hypothetical protein